MIYGISTTKDLWCVNDPTKTFKICKYVSVPTEDLWYVQVSVPSEDLWYVQVSVPTEDLWHVTDIVFV